MTDVSDKGAVTRRPRMILLTQWFDPEPTFKGLLFARALVARGFDVEVVTAFPNYPGGKVYDGYSIRPIQREERDGVKITRLAIYPSHDQKALHRIANYVSFFLSAALYLTFFARKADVLYAYHPPLTVSMAAAVAKLFRRTPTVVDIQDMWPDTLRATGMMNNPRVLGIVDVACSWVYRRVDKIVVLSPGFRRLLIERNVPEEKISVIYNWADEASVASVAGDTPAAMSEPGRFRVLFAGNMGRAQGLDTVLDAARQLLTTTPRAEICFLGGGLELERLKARVSDEQLTNVRFLPKVPMAEVGAFLAAADCLLVHLKADPLFKITIPSKTQAYMASAKATIIAVEGDAADLIADSGGGCVVPPENADELAKAIAALAARPAGDLAAMGQAAKRYYDEHLSLAKGADSFAALLRGLAKA